ncbi:MAG: mechanosensitive ion channel [Bacteroides sp.]|nr:mechanosensitive ion channel [Bacteroides sp.]
MEELSQYEKLLESLLTQVTTIGLGILKALIIFAIGKIIINIINRLVYKVLTRRRVDLSAKSFIRSTVNVSLLILLIIAMIGALGIQTTSFAALVASIGVSIGMALSGNLSNFAGGIIILVFKPFKVGDYITAQGISGTVKEIQIFHTILHTSDNIRQYIPNGSLSSGIVSNYNVDKRRVQWIVGIDYGEDFERVKKILEEVLSKEPRILPDPSPFIALHALDNSSVNIMVRAWTNSSDYWGVYFDINKAIYETFNKENIEFPFPQLTVHQKTATLS